MEKPYERVMMLLNLKKFTLETVFEPSKLIKIELIFVLFERLLVQVGFPSYIIYMTDVINIILLFISIKKKVIFEWKKFNIFILIYGVMIIFGSITAFFYYSELGGGPLYTIIEIFYFSFQK